MFHFLTVRQPVECRRFEDEIRQFAVVPLGLAGTSSGPSQVLSAVVWDSWITEASADDPLVQRWTTSAKQQTLLHHRKSGGATFTLVLSLIARQLDGELEPRTNEIISENFRGYSLIISIDSCFADDTIAYPTYSDRSVFRVLYCVAQRCMCIEVK